MRLSASFWCPRCYSWLFGCLLRVCKLTEAAVNSKAIINFRHHVSPMSAYIFTLFCSNDTCTDQVPEECSDIVPYTSYPNKRFGLETEDDYVSFANNVSTALRNCTVDNATAHWGVCNMMFPRCLLGYDLHLCQYTCLGR